MIDGVTHATLLSSQGNGGGQPWTCPRTTDSVVESFYKCCSDQCLETSKDDWGCCFCWSPQVVRETKVANLEGAGGWLTVNLLLEFVQVKATAVPKPGGVKDNWWCCSCEVLDSGSGQAYGVPRLPNVLLAIVLVETVLLLTVLLLPKNYYCCCNIYWTQSSSPHKEYSLGWWIPGIPIVFTKHGTNASQIRRQVDSSSSIFNTFCTNPTSF